MLLINFAVSELHCAVRGAERSEHPINKLRGAVVFAVFYYIFRTVLDPLVPILRSYKLNRN